MRGFKLNGNGDIVIGLKSGNTISPSGNQIQMVEGNELIAQKILIALGTNKGEWFWNEELGIDFDMVIGKGIAEEMIQSQIEQGIRQVDESMFLSDFTVDFDNKHRTATVNFTVENNGGKIAKFEKVYGAETNTSLEDRLEAANAKIAIYENATAKLERRLNYSMP